MSGSRAASSLAAIVARKEKLEEELRNVERQACYSNWELLEACIGWRGLMTISSTVSRLVVYDLETAYLNDQSQCGNVLKGFEGFLSSSKNNANVKRLRKFQIEDRLFSLSSVTSPAGEETAGTLLPEFRHDGALNGGLPRKQTIASTNGNTKNANQKRGRTGPREGKRMRQTTEHDEEDDDLLI